MKIIRSFEPGDRYQYDFVLCTCARGWAQVDTAQDASWFGTWASPTERTILNFAEGDVTRTICDTDEEFAAALREIDRWNRDHGYGLARIDPGFDLALKAAFEPTFPKWPAAQREGRLIERADQAICAPGRRPRLGNCPGSVRWAHEGGSCWRSSTVC